MPIAARSAAVGWNVVSSQACDLAHERETSDLAHREARPQPGGTASDRHRCADDTRSEALGHDEVGVRRRVDTTVDVALAADDGRLEEARDGAGGLHGLGRCRRRGARPTEHRAPPAVQLDGHDPQRCRRPAAPVQGLEGLGDVIGRQLTGREHRRGREPGRTSHGARNARTRRAGEDIPLAEAGPPVADAYPARFVSARVSLTYWAGVTGAERWCCSVAGTSSETTATASMCGLRQRLRRSGVRPRKRGAASPRRAIAAVMRYLTVRKDPHRSAPRSRRQGTRLVAGSPAASPRRPVQHMSEPAVRARRRRYDGCLRRLLGHCHALHDNGND